jgi:hypothetical protein
MKALLRLERITSMARTTTTKKARSTSGKSRKNTKKESALKRFTRDHGMAMIFIVAFAVIGTIATFWTRAATTSATGTVTGIASKCLDNLDGKAVNGNKISLWTCDSTSSQQWTLPGDGTVRNNGYCLDVRGAGKTKGTIVQLYKCNGTVAQQWKVNSDKSVVNPNSGLCLDDQHSVTTDGNTIWIWTCNGTSAQKWTVPTASTSTGGGSGSGTGTGTGTGTGSGSGGGTSTSGAAMPVGNLTGWKQVFADDFAGTVPKGAFSDCNHNTDTPQAYCGGLKNYGAYYTNWWAYPNGWPDTAESCREGLSGCPDKSIHPTIGGDYQPEKAVSVSGGQMHIAMSRPSSGNNIVATMVPRKCMSQQYGRYVERFRVSTGGKGFKSAHLFYDNGYEMDYPESDDYSQTINAFTHPSEENFSTNAKWSDWHTTTIEWTAGSVKYYMDGKLIGTAKKNIANFKMTWALQNESSIAGPYASVGTKAQLDLDWVTCYSQ